MELDPVLKSGSACRRREERRGATKAQSEGRRFQVSEYSDSKDDLKFLLTDI